MLYRSRRSVQICRTAIVERTSNPLRQRREQESPALVPLVALEQHQQADERAIEVGDASHFEPQVFLGKACFKERLSQWGQVGPGPGAAQDKRAAVSVFPQFHCGPLELIRSE